MYQPVDPAAGDPDRPIPAGHSHWHALGKPFEMLELNRLQAMLPRGPVHPADFEKLIKLAEKAGKADTESFIEAYGRDGHGDGPLPDAWSEEFDGFRNGAYFKAIDFSEKILARIDGEPVRSESASAVCQQMRNGYMLGRAAAKVEAENAVLRAPGR